jgi:antitoxin component of MazEF toxin-antitoxin module
MQVVFVEVGKFAGPAASQAADAEIGVSEGQKVEVRAEGGRIIVELARAPLTWANMLENTSPDELRKAFDWGEDMGRQLGR